MIGKLIEGCIRNRGLVLIAALFLVAASVWAMFAIKVDAIPDLSDVQVIVKADFPGQAPEIVEKQVTYPLTTAMLQVPHAKAVRGNSMFGSSFVYIIFEDGTDIYWARSRVLEQLSFLSGRLPEGVNPQLGPDATGVGWVYQYVLVTGRYCPQHPNGLWHDPQTQAWYPSPDAAGDDHKVRRRLEHRRIFQGSRTVWVDPRTELRYDLVDDAPEAARQRLRRVELVKGHDTCPLDGTPLRDSDVDLAQLRSLQDWYLRYELTAVPGVSEVAPIGGFVKQYQVVVDPVKLQAYQMPIARIQEAIARSNLDVGGRVIEMSETEYMVRGVGYLGALSDEEMEQARREGRPVEEMVTQKVLQELRQVALGASPAGTPLHVGDVAEVRIGPEIRRGVAEWNGEGEVVGGIVVMRFGENARATIDGVKAKLADLVRGLPPGVAVETAYDRSDLIDRAVGTLRHTLIQEITVVALVCILFLLHARSELVAVFVVPTGVLASLLLMHLLGINANIMSLGGIAIAIGVMVDSSIVMVENAHKHLDREDARLRALQQAGRRAVPRPRTEIILEAAREVGPSLFFSLLIIVISFLPIFVLREESGRMFKPLAYTKTFAMAAAALLSVTVVPVLMSYFITARVLPRHWGWRRNLALTLAAMLAPAGVLLVVPMGQWEDYRPWMALGWVVFMGMLLVPQKIIHEEANPLSRFLQWLYQPFFVLAMRFWPVTVAVTAAGIVWVILFFASLSPGIAARFPIVTALTPSLGSEFMPPLEEGDLLYMPTTDPGISVTKARELLQQTDALIKQFPEVMSVMGKVGRAETATDPAPLEMLETTVMLHRDKSRWRQVPEKRWLGDFLPARWAYKLRPITVEELVYGYHLPDGTTVPGLDDAVRLPGLNNAWTMPIRTRIDMLSTGIRTPVGIKVMGPDLVMVGELAEQVAAAVRSDAATGPYTRSAYAEKTSGGRYLDVVPDREQIARYNLHVSDVQAAVMSAIGGMEVTSTVEGLERYSVNVRYPHELRDNIPALQQVLVAAPSGAQVPLGQLAQFAIRQGPPMIKSENARLTSWVYVEITGIDLGTYVQAARRAVAERVALPAGYSLVWSGQYEHMEASRTQLIVSVALAGMVILLLLYLATRSWLRVGIILSAFPFSIIGAILMLWALDYNLSIAVWVGIIALVGLDAETSLVMLLYLDNSFERFQREGRMRNVNDLWHAVQDGAVKRIRPKTMTVATTFIGLVPLMFGSGAGADTMRRLAAPMIGGLATSFLLELLIYPVLFYLAKRLTLRGRPEEPSPFEREGALTVA